MIERLLELGRLFDVSEAITQRAFIVFLKSLKFCHKTSFDRTKALSCQVRFCKDNNKVILQRWHPKA